MNPIGQRGIDAHLRELDQDGLTILPRRDSLHRAYPIVVALSIAVAAVVTACSPKVGSESWCSTKKETPRGDWSTNEAADFAKHCIFR